MVSKKQLKPRRKWGRWRAEEYVHVKKKCGKGVITLFRAEN
jgi:hypothetical protein